MPTMNRRPGANRPTSRPSVPNYSRRENSKRRDIRMDRRRRRQNNFPNLPLIFVILTVILAGVVVLVISAGRKNSRPGSASASVPEEAVHEPLPSEEAAEEPEPEIPPEESAPQPDEPETPPEQTPNQTEGGLIYIDDRVPNYSASNPVWETLHFEWESQDKRGMVQADVSIDREMYQYYRSLGRYYAIEEYKNYVNDANNRAIIAEIVEAIRNTANSHGYSDAAVVREIAKFVQDTIEYQYDFDTTGEEEYPRYPIETLYERQGDCEDTSILMAALLKELGYEVGFLNPPEHLAVVLRTSDDYSGGAYYEIDGHRYLYIESTGSGWKIGEIPEDVQGQPAAFYAIG